MDAYFARFGGVRDYLRHSVDGARRCCYTQTLLGPAALPPRSDRDNRQRLGTGRAGRAQRSDQASAADIIGVAMLAVQRRMDAEGLRSRLPLQVHDELVRAPKVLARAGAATGYMTETNRHEV